MKTKFPFGIRVHTLVSILLLGGILLYSQTLTAQTKREVGNLILEDVPEVPESIKNRLQQFQSSRPANFVDWIPGNKGILMSTRFGNTRQLFTISEPGKFRNQITFFDEPVQSAKFCPSQDHPGFLYLKDTGGDEYTQIYWYDLNSRVSELISDGTSMNNRVIWSNKGDQYAFTSTRRNEVDFDIYTSNMSSPANADLKIDKGNGVWAVTDWSPDDSKLLVYQYISSTRINAFIYDLVTNELKQINDPSTESRFTPLKWDSTGEYIYLKDDSNREFLTLGKYHIKSGQTTYITNNIPWDIGHFVISPDRKNGAFTINENGSTKLYLLDVDTDTFKLANEIPPGYILSINFNPTGDQLGMTLNNAETPGDVFSLDLKTNQLKQWTFSEVGGLNTNTFPKPQLFSYETFDSVNGKKRTIPAYLYEPLNHNGKLPVIIVIHGGPAGQSRPSFSPMNSYMANELGVAIITPNVRGSNGYGKSYLKLDNGYKREDSVKDIGKLLEWIENNEKFDADRIAVIGASYGGYMVLASMMHYNEKLRCGIDIVGIGNFVSFLENTSEYRRDLRRVEYGDERDPKMREFLESISPAKHASEITKPLFVIQGANDPRVPASESEQMVKAIRENGGTVWYMLAKDEGHGFRKKENLDHMSEVMVLFLKEHLLDYSNPSTK